MRASACFKSYLYLHRTVLLLILVPLGHACFNTAACRCLLSQGHGIALAAIGVVLLLWFAPVRTHFDVGLDSPASIMNDAVVTDDLRPIGDTGKVSI